MSDVAQLKIALEAANARIAELEAQLPPPGPPVMLMSLMSGRRQRRADADLHHGQLGGRAHQL